MLYCFFFFQAEDGIRDIGVTGVQTCALPIYPGRAPQPDQDAEGTTVTSSAHALVDVLAAEGSGEGGFESPTIAEFYPEPLASFSLLGIDFEITRITVIMWIATAAILTLLVLAARKASIVPGKLQYEIGRAHV